MSQDSAPPKPGPAVWLWPAAAALLAAWPVWRSMFPEVPDVGDGWLRLQPLAGLANALLYLAWAAKWRRRVHDLALPLWAILLAAGSVIVATRRGDAAAADLGALMICWIASPTIFATLVLLQAQAAGIGAGCKPPHHAGLLPPILWLGAGLGIAMLAVTFVTAISSASPAIMGVMSPGLVLAWASLSDTARAILSKRQVHFSDATSLQRLSRGRRWLLRAPTVLVSDRVKLVSLYPAADIRPGELVGLAAAATMDDESDIARAIQEFGVSHRIRLPALRQRHDGPSVGPRRATLANGTVVELCAADETLDLAAHAEAIELAHAQHRIVLAVVERVPNSRVLGVLVFAISARAGAPEALRLLRDRKIAVTLTAPPRDAADELALKSLRIGRGGEGRADDTATAILHGAEASADNAGLAVGFGARRVSAVSHIVVAREDARSLVDLARFADDFQTRTRIVTLLASAPGLVLIAAAVGYVPVTPFLVTGVAIIGIAIATVAPQVLRLSPVLDNEGTEE